MDVDVRLFPEGYIDALALMMVEKQITQNSSSKDVMEMYWKLRCELLAEDESAQNKATNLQAVK